MGVGQLSIKCNEGANKATKESKPTVVVRNDVRYSSGEFGTLRICSFNIRECIPLIGY